MDAASASPKEIADETATDCVPAADRSDNVGLAHLARPPVEIDMITRHTGISASAVYPVSA